MKTRSLPLSGEMVACCIATSPGFGEAEAGASCATSAIARLQALHWILAHPLRGKGPPAAPAELSGGVLGGPWAVGYRDGKERLWAGFSASSPCYSPLLPALAEGERVSASA